MSLKPAVTSASTAAPSTPIPAPDETPVPTVSFGIAKRGGVYHVVATTAEGSHVIFKDDFRPLAEEEFTRAVLRYWHDPEGAMKAVVK